MRKIEIIMIVIFCSMLFGGSLATAFLPEKDYSVIENRELAHRPKITKKKLLNGKFQSEYDTYISDQFFKRDAWVSLSVMIQAVMGKKDINGVYIGKEGYLLEKNDESDFDSAQVGENVGYLAAFLNETAQIYGKEHVSCIMIPSKAFALTNRLPDFANINGHGEVLKSIKKNLSNQEMLVDICDELKKHRQEYIYYRTDHHWTTLGAYYAFASWAGQTGQASVQPLEYYGRETVFDDFYGTTYNKVHLKVPADKVEIFHCLGEDGVLVEMDDDKTKSNTMYFEEEAKKGFNRYNLFFSKNTFKIEVNTKSKSKKTLLLIKDSFANCFVPFLTEDYGKIIMLDYRYGKTPVGKIMSENDDITDVLVMFNTEKFMENTKLAKLADTRTESKTMEEFKLEDFLE